MRSLMLVSADAGAACRDDVAHDRRPCPEFLHLEDTHGVELLDWSRLGSSSGRRSVRRSLAHARAALRRVPDVDAVLSDGEHVGIPLAVAMRKLGIDTPHVVIGHHLDTPNKVRAFRMLRPERRIDRILVHSANQVALLTRALAIPSSLLAVVPYGVDTGFWAPQDVEQEPGLVVAAGREHRDYRTLLEALPPDAHLVVADGSPFSPGASRRSPDQWPDDVVRRAFDPIALRDLYARAAVVVVPVVETSFPAGITTLLEALSMGKAVVWSQTRGLAGAVPDDAAVTVPPGDTRALRATLADLLHDPGRRRVLGEQARAFVVHELGVGAYAGELARHLAEVRDDRLQLGRLRATTRIEDAPRRNGHTRSRYDTAFRSGESAKPARPRQRRR